jgi:hypothetical protein
MICHTGSRQLGKSVKSRPNQPPEIRIGRRTEKCARSWPDLVPFHAVEPAILVGAAADRQDQGRSAASDGRFDLPRA